MTDTPDDLQAILRRFEAKDTVDQLHILATRMSEIATAVAVHGERDTAIMDRLGKLETKVDESAEKLDNIEAMANRYRGGIMVVMVFGGMMGAIVAFWDRFAKWVHP